MKTKSILQLVLCSALIPFALQAKPQGGQSGGAGQGNRPNLKEMFNRLDADQSGTLSKEEAKGPMAKNFDKIDTDGNGELSKKELRAQGDKRRDQVKEKGAKMKEADTDGNGNISYDEADAAGLQKLVENFEKVDADGDGEIAKQEMREMRKAQGKKERKGQAEE